MNKCTPTLGGGAPLTGFSHDGGELLWCYSFVFSDGACCQPGLQSSSRPVRYQHEPALRWQRRVGPDKYSPNCSILVQLPHAALSPSVKFVDRRADSGNRWRVDFTVLPEQYSTPAMAVTHALIRRIKF
ncbi:hypothetical protein BaRGS_00028021 [Batillaria attramentaria]|uniref:Uncharacterized protein n=1 Tax=Batillaria attramentaria TaxID=370345 RepID=A0ABD0K1Q4_9CAEN